MLLRKLLYLIILLFCLLNSATSLSQTHNLNQEYIKFKNYDQGSITLNSGRDLYYTVESRKVRNGIETVKATIDDPGMPLFINASVIVTLDHIKQEISGFIETSDGHYRINPRTDNYTVWQKTETPDILDSIYFASEQDVPPNKASLTESGHIADLINVGEKDNSGRYVIDVLIAYSQEAADDVGNIQTEAEMYVESVNTALLNSNIISVYLRLVGVSVGGQNPGVLTSVLRDGKEWFKDDIERLAPDLIGFIQRWNGAPGSAIGWGGVGGDTLVMGAAWPGAYRHEVGHNIGGIHCKEAGDSGYHYGFSPRQGLGTTQCGNNMAYYSTPLVIHPVEGALGTTHSQDMARVWRENAAKHSGRRIHKVPFPGDDNTTPILLQAEDYIEYSDTTPGNTGGEYRNDGVDIEQTSDTGGGYNVGWTAKDEWLSYPINSPAAASYIVSYRVASEVDGGLIQFEKQGGIPIYGTIDVPNTGGWQNWTTISHIVDLPAGQQNIALAIREGNFNLNWIKIDKLGDITEGYFRIQSQMDPTLFVHKEEGDLGLGPISSGWWSAQWAFEQAEDNGFYRIKNRWAPNRNDEYLHVEYGALETGEIPSGWLSSQWALESVEGSSWLYRIRNRWKTNHYITIDEGEVMSGPIIPDQDGAIWTFTPVN